MYKKNNTKTPSDLSQGKTSLLSTSKFEVFLVFDDRTLTFDRHLEMAPCPGHF